MKLKFTLGALLMVASSFLASIPAMAANTFYNAGDLIMTFQMVGSTNTVYADLGAATTYRRAASEFGTLTNVSNIANLNTTLTDAFGAGWASNTNIYAGLAAVRSISNTSSAVVSGDASRTLYISASRSSIGSAGYANSSTPTVGTNTDMTSAASAISAQNNVLGTSYSVAQTVSLTDVSLIDDKQPITTFSGANFQGTAFGVFGGGIQQQGSASSFGSVGTVDNVEFALDLYRIVAVNDKAGELNGALRTGEFQGTFVLDNSGSVSFMTTIPEPSAFALVGIAAGSFVLRRRRGN